MASQEVDNAELGTASSGGAPGGQAELEGVNNSVYQPIDGSQDYQKMGLQTLGFISSGTLSVIAGRKPTRGLMENSFGMNIASATIALVGIVFLSINLAVNNQSIKSCQSSNSPDLCIYMGSSSNGLVSLMLILTLLELCITISVSTMWCKANCCGLREAISSTPSSVE
uniref:Membrane spanning 4-domains A3 n=1 Tax=Propithecus coquereli TaxID=379532 RepID=A0A2K6G8M5_PROCO